MTSKLFCRCIVLSICLGAGSVYAGPITYQFSTVLELENGPDTFNLNGASMHFLAEIAKDTRYEVDPTFGWLAFPLASYRWSITGGSTIDGVYPGTTTGNFSLLVWGDSVGGFFPLAPFSDLAIYQSNLGGVEGNLVLPGDFGPLLTAPPAPPSFTSWSTSDSSQYNWNRNGRFAFSEVALPSTVWLFLAATISLVRSRRQRR